MTWIMAAFTYLVSWWIVWIAVLPFGAQPEAQPQAGHARSAPAKPMFARKILATSVVAAILVAALAWLMSSGLVSLRDAIPSDTP